MTKEFEELHKKAFIDYVEGQVNDDLFCLEHLQDVDDCDSSICTLNAIAKKEEDQGIRFDMYARAVEDYAWLQEFVPGIIIYSAGGMVPFQAEGYISGMPFYYRERGGAASLRVANSINECYGSTDALYAANVNVEEFREGPGWISTLIYLVEKLEKTPYLYQFQSDEVDFGSTGNDKENMKKKLDENGNVLHGNRAGWGFTEEEAFEWHKESMEGSRDYFCKREKYDRELGKYVPAPELSWTDEEFDHYVELQNVQPIVIKTFGEDKVYPDIDPVFEVNVPEAWRNDEGIIEIPNEIWRKEEENDDNY